uniref:Calcineurin-like phosphoesterase domain-containing protein n=1 Tax=Lotharella globosa TaxID=91324 RepID=A0A7S4DUT7_9EUKA
MVRFGVNAYINGHDHAMQHLSKDGVQYFGNGVGGFDLHPIDKKRMWPNDGEELRWASNSRHGFALHDVGPEGMRIRFAQVTESAEVAAPDDKGITSEVGYTIVYDTFVPFRHRSEYVRR